MCRIGLKAMNSTLKESLGNSDLVRYPRYFLVSSRKRETWEGVLLIPRAQAAS